MYFIKHNLYAFDKFVLYEFLVENQINKRIKILRLDNGGKYKSNAFNLYCQKHGIKRQFTITNTPQQNGVSKKKNHTLIGVALFLLINSHLLKTFWGKTLSTANYLQNRSPIKALLNKTF
jgi:transposase InsO family protein